MNSSGYSLSGLDEYPSARRSPLAAVMWLLIVAAVFFGPLDISSGAVKMSVGLDWQVAIKLLIFGCTTSIGLYGVLTSSAVREAMMTMPVVGVTTILLLAALATPTAISGASLPTTLVNFGNLMFLVTALLTWKLRGVGLAVLVGVLATATVALSFWFFVPAYGVFPELLGDGLVVERLSGTAHPNAVGRAMIIGLLLTTYFYRTGTFTLAVAGPLMGCFAVAAFLAWSRTAIAAGVVGMLILYLDRFCSRAGIIALSFGILVGIGGVSSLYIRGAEDQVVGSLLSKLSKSGDAEEITSGTGRSEIWSKAIGLISSRPIVGHGFGAAPSLMINHSQATHNAVLHASLTAGIGGGIVMFSLMIWCLYLSLNADALLIRTLAGFVVIASLAEDAVLETFPGPVTILFIVCCIYPVMFRQHRLIVGRQLVGASP